MTTTTERPNRRAYRWRRTAAVLTAAALGVGASLVVAAPARADDPLPADRISWGIKQSWRTYIGTQGTVTPQAPAVFDGSGPTSPYAFPATASATPAGVTVDGSGGVHYVAHGGALDLTLGTPTIVVTGSTGTIAVDYVLGGTAHDDVVIAEIGTATLTPAAGRLDLTGTGVTLTAAGAEMFDSHYEAGEELDDITATVPAPASVTLDATVVDAAGGTVTVHGSGFDPALAIASRPPLSGHPAGVYIVFGRFADAWQPSKGAPSSARKGLAASEGGTKWAVLAEDEETIGGDAAGAIALEPDGTFTATLSVRRTWDGMPETGNFGVYTYAGGGAVAAAYETYTPIHFTSAVSITAAAKVYGKTGTAHVAVTPAEASGTVEVAAGGRVLGTATVTAGAATITLPANLAVGTQRLTATYSGDNIWAPATAATMVTISKATPKVTLTLAKKKIRADARAKAKVKVKTAGTVTTGKVLVKAKKRTADGTLGKATKRTATLTAGPAASKVKVRLPSLRPGTYVVTVRYLGNNRIRAAGGPSVVLTVRR